MRTDTKTDPAHYNQQEIQPITVINAWALGFSLGNCVKYISRAGKKSGESELDDLRKARWLDPVFYVPHRRRPMMKGEAWKPGRPKFTECESATTFDRLTGNLERTCQDAYAAYEDNLAAGFDPGLARDCLPVGIFSSCWVTCNPRSIMAFLSLRVHEPDAKFVSYPLHEIDQAARKLEAIFAGFWPVTHAAFVANGRVAP